MEMPISHCIYPEIQKENIVWKSENDVREIISTLCKYKDVDIIAGAVCVDHIHLSVAIPPKLVFQILWDT